jgi:type IV secretory pathway TraG/TraD family ATPase VirD4
VVVNDIKRELWDATAGWRKKGLAGQSLMFDPRGLGSKFDPFAGKITDSAPLQRYSFTGRVKGRTPSLQSGQLLC